MLSLAELREQQPARLVTQLVEIQKSQMPQAKSKWFIEQLECLYFHPTRDMSGGRKGINRDSDHCILRRATINAFEQRAYVALSYTWNASPYEIDTDSGAFYVERKSRPPGNSCELEPSPVRNSIFRRLRNYMQYAGAELLWIDQHSIEQQPGDEKEAGMQAMDCVYGLSDFPLTLLGRPITTSDELQRLIQLLKGRLVRQKRGEYELSPTTTVDEAVRVLELLREITSDLWWTRGWTFQEDYRGGANMTLLMTHSSDLEDEKLARDSKHTTLGCLPGELCISSIAFHEQATKLCLAYQRQVTPMPGLYNPVLERAGRYAILLRKPGGDGQMTNPKSMSPRVMADISVRDLFDVWDRLAIAANCCQYSTRLDSQELQKQGRSLSLSMLALFLLNGEILSNDDDPGAPTTGELQQMTMMEFMDAQTFDGMFPPYSKHGLTFNKSCRFTQCLLTADGLRTRGSLWGIHSLLSTERMSHHRPPFEHDSKHGLHRHDRRRLRQLASELAEMDEGGEFLAERLDRFLEEDRYVDPEQVTFAKEWLDLMAQSVVDAIDRKQTLGIACLLDDELPGVKSGGIFIVEDEDEWDADMLPSGEAPTKTQNHPKRYIFTAARPGGEGVDAYLNDIDRHVSLVVESPDRQRLFTKHWIHGLCFVEGCPQQDVVFPWPAALRDL